jgi:hypothetical protein
MHVLLFQSICSEIIILQEEPGQSVFFDRCTCMCFFLCGAHACKDE